MNTRKTLVGAACIALQPLLLNAIGLPITAYVIRSLGPTGYGEWSIGVSLVGLVTVLSNLGMRPLFARRVAQTPDEARVEIGYQLGLRGLLSLGAAIVALLACVCLRYAPTVLLCTAVTACGMVISALSGVFEDVLQGGQRLKTQAAVSLTAGVVLTGLSLIAAMRGLGPVGVAWAYVSGPATAFVLLAIAAAQMKFSIRVRWDLQRYSGVLKESRLLGAGFMLSALRDRIEQLLVPKLLGIFAFGNFAAGSLLPDRLTAVPSGLYTAFFAGIARSYKEDRSESARQVSRLVSLTLITCVPLAVLGTFLARAVAELIFPKSADICREVIQVTMWALPCVGVMLSMSSALQAAGAHDAGARASMLTTIATAPISILLIVRFGLVGACVSYVVRPLLGIVFFLPAFLRAFPDVAPSIPVVRICMSAIVMGTGLYWAAERWGHRPLVAVSCATISVGIYIAALVACRVVRPSMLAGLGRLGPAGATE